MGNSFLTKAPPAAIMQDASLFLLVVTESRALGVSGHLQASSHVLLSVTSQRRFVKQSHEYTTLTPSLSTLTIYTNINISKNKQNNKKQINTDAVESQI